MPSARRLARDMNVDLRAVPGSRPQRRRAPRGRRGVRELRQPHARAAAASASRPRQLRPRGRAQTPRRAGAFAPGERETRIPFRGVRRKIAEAMVRSKFTAPHFTVVEEVDVTELVKLREKAKAIGAESNVKVTFMPFIMKATALALAKYPMLNGAPRRDERRSSCATATSTSASRWTRTTA